MGGIGKAVGKVTGGLLGSSPDAQERSISQEEQDLYKAQAESIRKQTEIAEEQNLISKQQRERYQKIWLDPDSADADEIRNSLAEFHSAISGEDIDPSRYEGKNLEEIQSDILANASAAYKTEANKYITDSGQLTKEYVGTIEGLSDEFVNKYQASADELTGAIREAQGKLGTIDDDILARETGAATAGISTAFQEAQKEYLSAASRRGLAGSGIEQEGLAELGTQGALARASATAGARQSAYGLTQQQTMQELGLSQTLAQQQQGQLSQEFQTGQLATQQGIAGMLQNQALQQGNFTQGLNLLGQSAQTYASAGNLANAGLGQQINASTAYMNLQGQMDMQTQAARSGLASSLIGFSAGGGFSGGDTASAASAAGAFSDSRLKTNISLVDNINGVNMYTWDWNNKGNELGMSGSGFGVLADEMEDSMLVDNDSGYLMVDYSKVLNKIQGL